VDVTVAVAVAVAVESIETTVSVAESVVRQKQLKRIRKLVNLTNSILTSFDAVVSDSVAVRVRCSVRVVAAGLAVVDSYCYYWYCGCDYVSNERTDYVVAVADNVADVSVVTGTVSVAVAVAVKLERRCAVAAVPRLECEVVSVSVSISIPTIVVVVVVAVAAAAARSTETIGIEKSATSNLRDCKHN
jgi:hypothetical protein